MRSRGLIAAIACALVCAATAAAGTDVRRPALTWVRGEGSYTNAARTPKSHKITTIVIHATDGGSLAGNVWWLSGGHSHASAHYVVSRDGSIVQLVHLSDIAWHAGNWNVNVHSIGVEHVGETYDPNGFTAAEYASSARLVAWLVRRYDIPVDRRHIIGHAQVPDPNDGSLTGGSDHHTDPGPYFKWGYYLNLVRHFAFPERYEVKVDTTTIDRGETLTGIVPWNVATKRANRVDFAIDGEIVWTDRRKPFAFAGGRGWNTTNVANGSHILSVRATGRGRSVVQSIPVHVVNHDFALTTAGVRDWQRVKGALHVRANVRGAKTRGIGLYVDGKIVSRDKRAPFGLWWNSKKVRDGKHVVTVAATAADGRVAKRRVTIVVKNAVAPKKKPLPLPLPPAPHVVSQTVADGQLVSGPVDWRVHTIGAVARVEFVVDGVVAATQTREPWSFGWDATNATAGPHTLEARAYTKDGRSDKAAVTVTR